MSKEFESEITAVEYLSSKRQHAWIGKKMKQIFIWHEYAKIIDELSRRHKILDDLWKVIFTLTFGSEEKFLQQWMHALNHLSLKDPQQVYQLAKYITQSPPKKEMYPLTLTTFFPYSLYEQYGKDVVDQMMPYRLDYKKSQITVESYNDVDVVVSAELHVLPYCEFAISSLQLPYLNDRNKLQYKGSYRIALQYKSSYRIAFHHEPHHDEKSFSGECETFDNYLHFREYTDIDRSNYGYEVGIVIPGQTSAKLTFEICYPREF